MIINSLKLKNIRSYLEEEMIFPDGSIMLSGDIGTGKTTILLAIEFALFGIMRGQVSGTTLLRHGTKDGYVELEFTVEGKKVLIRRELKRSVKTVSQDAGYIIISGEKQDLTPQELKSKILTLLGYPDELLTKSKALIYRYTVYTAQEEMKQILAEKPEERLDVLRRIFNIDKYKRIKDNILSYQKELRTKIATLEGRTEDLEQKENELKDYKEKVTLFENEINKITLEVEEKKKIYLTEKEKTDLIDKKRTELLKLKSELNSKKENIERQKIIAKEKEEEIVSLKEKVSLIKSELKETDFTKTKEELKLAEEKIVAIEENLQKVIERQSAFNQKSRGSEEIIQKITSLDICPTCEQQVTIEYKEKVKQREDAKVKTIQEQLSKLQELKEKRQKELYQLKKRIEELNNELSEEKILLLKKKQVIEYEERIAMSKQIIDRTIKESQETEKQILDIQEKISGVKDVEEEYLKARKKLETTSDELKQKEIMLAEKKREQQSINEVMQRLILEIEKKKESRVELNKTRQVKEWMLKYFLSVIYLMEKQIMLKIHQEFNETFQDWFNTLIEDENLNVRLDESFSPMINQNGYETTIDNLSGGEKTSVALAYRLALNKVINNFISTIKTKDLLILDEPTDGFSTEQLDRVRDVLEKINIKQIILVSHEPKMESYVEHIVRVHKEEHVSRVITS